jgi:hypothetical protein
VNRVSKTPVTWDDARSFGDAGGPDQPAFRVAELPFGLVDRRDQIVSRRSDERAGEVGDPRAVLPDAVGDDRQLGRG